VLRGVYRAEVALGASLDLGACRSTTVGGGDTSIA